MPHDRVLYKQDNGALFYKLEIVLSHSDYMTVLDRFRNNINGRGALLVLKAAFAGKAFWEKIIKYFENFL